MALVRDGASERGASAHAAGAHVGLGACIVVVARCHLLAQAVAVAFACVAARGGRRRAAARIRAWVASDGDVGAGSDLARKDAALARTCAGAVAAHALGRALVAGAIRGRDARLAVGQLGAAVSVETGLARAAIIHGGAAGAARGRRIVALVGEARLRIGGRGTIPVAVAIGGRGQRPRRATGPTATDARRPRPARSKSVTGAIPRAITRGGVAGRAPGLGIGAACGNWQAASYLPRHLAGQASPSGRVVAACGIAAHTLGTVPTCTLGRRGASRAIRLQAAGVVDTGVGGHAVGVRGACGLAGGRAADEGAAGGTARSDTCSCTIARRRRCLLGGRGAHRGATILAVVIPGTSAGLACPRGAARRLRGRQALTLRVGRAVGDRAAQAQRAG